MPLIIAALVGIVLGAIVAIAYMRTAKQGSLHEAEEKIQSAHAQAESLIGDAKRQAETLKKEALLEAKEEIIKNKQAAEAEDKQRKSEIRALENRVMQREESLDRRNDALDKREPSATRPLRRFSPWRSSAVPPTIPPRSPSRPFIFPPMTLRAASSVARVVTSVLSSRFPASTL